MRPAFRAACVAALLAIASLAQSITLPSYPSPNYVSLNWLYQNKMRWAGPWLIGTAYNSQDVTTYGGYTYVSLGIGNTGNAPAPGGTLWWAQLPTATSIWGTIGGTLSNQTDLQAALNTLQTNINGKQPTIATGTSSQFFLGDLSLATFNSSVWGVMGTAAPITYNSSTGVYGCPTCLLYTGSYTDPSWISLSWGGGKITGIPTLTNTFNGRSGTVVPTSSDYTWSMLGGTKQGSTSVPQMAGTNSGVAGVGLCNDANGNTTTSGCAAPLPSGAQTQTLQIQPNTGNSSTYQFTSQPQLVSTSYNYSGVAPTSPSTLTGGGGSQTVTLGVCPLGIYSTVTSSWAPVYLTAGASGTAEAITPTGGTCSGATLGIAGGTVIVSPVSNHGTGYAVSSATSGIVEAINSLPSGGHGGGAVFVPQGTWPIYSTITVIVPDAVLIEGAGKLSTTLHWYGSTSADVIFFNGTGTSGGLGQSHGIRDIQIEGDAVSSSTNYGLHVDNQSGFLAANVIIVQLANGVKLTGTVDWQNTCRDMVINLPAVGGGTGVSVNATPGSDFFSNVQVGGDHTANTTAWSIAATSGLTLQAVTSLYAGYGMAVTPGTGQSVKWLWVTDSVFDTSNQQGIYISPSGTGTAYGLHFIDSWTSNNTGYGTHISGTGGGVDGVSLIGHRSIGNGTLGYLLDGTPINVTLTNCIAAGNSTSSSGTYHGLEVQANVSRWAVNGGIYGQAYGSTNTQGYGIYVVGGTGDYYSINNALVLPNVTGGIVNGATGTHGRIVGNIGYNPVGASTLTCSGSPCTLPATVNASPSTLYLSGGSTSGVTRGGSTVCTATPCAVQLGPGQQAIVTYSSVPTTITLDVQ